MKINVLTTMTVVAIALASCNKEERGDTENPHGEIRLSSGVTVQPRASFQMDTQIASGQQVTVYVEKATFGPQLYGHNVLTANGSGGFTGGETMYFPSDKSNVDIFAFHANATLGDNYPTETITHTVYTDQTTAANYAASDLLYSEQKEVAFTKSAVELTFYHMLTKIEIALKVGVGTPDLTAAEVSIVGTKLKADLTLVKRSDLTAWPFRAGMVTCAQSDNDATEIKISNDVTTDAHWGEEKYTYNEAVIVPQEIDRDAKFIRVKLANCGELFHRLDKTTSFLSGMKYSYHITVNLSSLTVASTIEDWDTINEPVNGDADME